MTALRKVLVVDDDPVVRMSFDRVLSGKGYAVITAENGAEALRKLKDGKYDAVYTDIRMPGMSGLEVAEQVRAQKPWTPVVIITGYGTAAAEARAKAAGVSAFLHKPLSPEMIEESARDVTAAPADEAQIAPAIEVKAPEAEAAAPVTAKAPAVEFETAAPGSALKNIALFFAAPFIALAYIIALPFVGLGVLAAMAARHAAKNGTVKAVGASLKNVGLFVAAPVLGLAYIVFFPLIGLAMLLWMAGKAVRGRS